MQLIKELEFILNYSKNSLFEKYIPQGSKLHQLYEGVTKDNLSEEKVAKIIYDGTINDKKYIMLKRSLLDKLLHLIYLADIPEGLLINRIHIETKLERLIFIAQKLVDTYAIHNAEKIALKVLKEAECYMLIRCQINALILLRKIYCIYAKTKKILKVQMKIKALLDQEKFEEKFMGLFELILSMVRYTRVQNEKINQLCIEAFEIEINPDSKVYLSQLQLKLHFYYLNQDWDGFAKINKQVDHFLSQKEYLCNKQTRIEIGQLKLKYYSSCSLIEEFHYQKKTLISQVSFEIFNQLNLEIEVFDFHLRHGNYDLAQNTLQRVRAADQFQYVNEIDQSAWEVRALLLNSIFPLPTKIFKTLSVHEFEYENNILTKDKFAYNVLFIICKLILQKKHDPEYFLEEGNNLKTYYQRYFKGKSESRTSNFLKYLYRYLKHQGNDEKISKIKSDYIKVNSSLQPTFDNIELLPFPKMVEEIFA